MQAKNLILTFFLASVAGMSQAESATVGFKLDPFPIFSLTNNATASDGFGGAWVSVNYFDATASTVSTAAGSQELELHSADLPPIASSGAPFGTGQLNVPAGKSSVSSQVEFQPGSMATTVNLADPKANEFGNANATWLRYFELSPRARATFSGVASVSDIGTSQPLMMNYQTLASSGPSFSSSAFLSVNSRNSSVYLNAVLLDCNVNLACNTGVSNGLASDQAFSYSASPDGKLSLTITNSLAVPIYGSFSLGLNSGATTVAAAIPEPQTYALMLAGFALLGAVASRQNKRG
jgi:PEP-CTERM motif